MTNNPCVFAYGPWGYCLDLTCRRQGGRCHYTGKPGINGCRCEAAAPSPNRADLERSRPVESALELYRQKVSELPACEEPWFSGTLQRLRSGEEDQVREISGRCLHLALALAEARAGKRDEAELFDQIQEANAALLESIHSFKGTGWDEFRRHAEQTITRRLAACA
jgi:hypothetical protein